MILYAGYHLKCFSCGCEFYGETLESRVCCECPMCEVPVSIEAGHIYWRLANDTIH